MKQFATPHSHPKSLDSGSTPEAMAKREVELGSGTLTCTDHGTLAAAVETYQLGKKYNLTPIIGLEGYFRDDNCPILGKLGIPRTDTIPKGVDRDRWAAQHPDGQSYFDYLKYMHITLHAMDYDGYLCMVRLLSRADERAERHGSELKPLFDWSSIEELASHNITATSSCLVGMVQRHLLDPNQNTDAAKAYFERLNHLFKGRFYVECFPHVCSHNFEKKVYLTVEVDGKQERQAYYFGKKFRTNAGEKDGISAEDLANRFDPEKHRELLEVMHYRKWTPLGYKLIGVEKREGFLQNECTAMAPEGDIQWGANIFVAGMAKKHNVPVLISDDSHFAHPEEKIVQDVRLAQMGDFRFWGSYHRQSSEEAWTYFRDKMKVPQATFEQWVENTQDWASRFKDFKFDTTVSLPTKFFPADTLSHLKKLIKEHGRMKMEPQYMARLKAEIDLLHKNGTIDLLPYFFLGEETCRVYSNQNKLTGPGRGSAAGLLLTYLLGITHVDPLQYDLSMERFLTLDRIKSKAMPDIDFDFPGRDLLVGEVTDVLEWEAEDGTVHILPEYFKVETDKGLLTIREALEQQADIKPWWLEKSTSEGQTDSAQQSG